MADEELYGETGLTEEAPASQTQTQTDPANVSPPPAPEPPTETAQAPVAQHAVPFAAYLDERDKRQERDRRIAEFEAREAERERKRQEAAAQRPHILESPEEYDAWWENRYQTLEQKLERTVEHARISERLVNSEDKWRDKLGDEKFEEFHAWTATQHPQWVKQAESQRDPFGFAYKEYEKVLKAKRADELDQQLQGKSLDEIIEERIAARLAEQAPQNAAPQRKRDPEGKFAPNPSPQRHTPKSLNEVAASAAAITGDGDDSALEGLYGSR